MKNIYVKIILVFILLSGFFNVSKAQFVNVPDAHFRTALFGLGYGPCFTGSMLDSTCALVRNTVIMPRLYDHDSQITDITGIEAFHNLEVFDCSGEYIDSLPELPKSLKKLSCDGYRIRYMAPLPDSLLELNCSGNPLYNLPNLPSTLLSLQCGGDSLTSLPVLPPNLRLLSCAGNYLNTLPALPNSLDSLICYNSNVNILPALPASLTYLNCSINNITSISSFPSSLKRLVCYNNQVSFFPDSLPQSLEELNCQNNKLSVLPVLNNSLKTLLFDGNQISTLQVKLPDSLTDLSCAVNLLTVIPDLPENLGSLNCAYNFLTELPEIPASVVWLQFGGNNISSIPSLRDTLELLSCENNPALSCLPNIKYVKYFYLDSTNISCVPNYFSAFYSEPSLSSFPVCDQFNQNYCGYYYNISGRTYFDIDTNCILSSTDLVKNNFKLQLFKNGDLIEQAYSVKNGNYSFDTDSLGVYEIKIDTSGIPFSVNCPVDLFYTDTLTVSDSVNEENDIAFKCKDGYDLAATSIVCSSVNSGDTIAVNIGAGDYSNMYDVHCANGVGGTVTVILSGLIDFMGPLANALTPVVNGNILTYYVSDFGSLNYKSAFNFFAMISPYSTLGSKICISVSISPSSDNDPSNNSISQCFTVAASYDPNDKTVFPSETLDINGDHWLTYTIRFQNTGTAPARNIFIVDTLDANLDFSSFQLLSYSHPTFVRIEQNGFARFDYPGINLVDSVSDEPNSHGYVQYRIKTKNNLVVGDQISNAAAIYFDFNAPVLTNTVINTITDCPQNMSLVFQAQDTLSSFVANASYQWINCTTNTIIPGAINQSFNPLLSGEYAVIVNSGNCTDTSDCYFISLTGINENFAESISVSPNPSSNNFTVSCPQYLTAKNISLKIFDALGKVIDEHKIISSSTILDASKWSTGVYFLQINSEGYSSTRKLIKQ